MCSGPFKLESFTPGLSSVLVANEYWYGYDDTYLERVELLNFNDTDALINALLSSQVDAIAQIPLALVEVINADERMSILNSETGMWLPFTMRVDRAPFDDPKVRQAFRLVVDREQMIEQVLSGFGTLGNDMFGPLSENYPDFPQRTQDIPRAKELLAEAGYPDGLEVELVTAPIQAGAVESAQVFAQQAAAAGITVNLRRVDVTTFFGDQYLQWDFAQDFWYTRDFMPQVIACALEESPSTRRIGTSRNSTLSSTGPAPSPMPVNGGTSSTNCRRCSTTTAATSSGASPTRLTPIRSTSEG